MQHVATRLPGARKPEITVVGDFVLDRYWHGKSSRVNPEGPGVVIAVDSETEQLGGAGGVVAVTHGLNIPTSSFGAVSTDRSGFVLAQLVNEASAGGSVLLWTLPQTTVKHRVISNGMLLHNRFDFEEIYELGDIESRLIDDMPLGKVIVVADYAKGVVTDPVMERLRRRADEEDLFVIVDPGHGRSLCEYGRVDLIKMNAEEAWVLTGKGPAEAAKELSESHHCAIVVTDGGDGMFYVNKDECVFVGAQPAVVRDVTGAGDTVIAAIAIGMLRKYDIRRTLQFAAELASKQVSQIGVGAVREGCDEDRI